MVERPLLPSLLAHQCVYVAVIVQQCWFVSGHRYLYLRILVAFETTFGTAAVVVGETLSHDWSAISML